MTTKAKRKTLDEHIATQRKWIEQCGGSRAGYILRYGSVNDENHSGDGGEAIFAADLAQLDKLLAMLARGRHYL